MNGTEQLFTLLTFVAYVIIIHHIPATPVNRIINAAFSLVVIAWCFLDATQIITIDEGVMLAEARSGLQMWQFGEFRTTHLLFALVQRAAALIGATPDTTTLKGLHTSFCIMVHGTLVVMLSRLFMDNFKPVGHVPALTSLLLLPTGLIAIKVFNYDFFVMELIVLTLVLALAAFSTRQFHYLWIAIPVSALAAQEKMIATPVMFAVALAAAYASKPLMGGLPQWASGSVKVFLALLICVGTMMLCGALVALMRPQDASVILTSSLARPLTQFAGTLGYFAFRVSTDQYYSAPLIFFLGLSVLLLILPMVRPFRTMATYMFRMLLSLPWPPIAAMSTLLFCVIAATSYETSTMLWAPYHPIAAGAYHPTVAFNGVIPHFEATSVFEHLLRSCGGAMAMFWAATPTAIWIVLLIGLGITIFSDPGAPRDSTPEIIVCGAMAMPVLWGIFQLPSGIGGKYFNIGILLLSIGAVWIMLRGMSVFNSGRARVVSIGAIGLYLAEIALFLPLGFDFRPAYLSAIKDAPRLGEPTFGWPGWGEEVALAAKGLLARLPPTQKITLIYFYPGAYFGNDRVAIVQNTHAAPRYTESEYFVVSKLSVVEGLSKFPSEVPAEFALGGLGQPYAWVYRGDRLRQAGFAF